MIFSTAYLPPVSYFAKMISADEIMIEGHEHFVKQTYRNRCDVLSANGILTLSIPLIHGGNKELTKDKRIAYAENWQKRHWRGVTSAYRNSPYFIYYEDELRFFYENKFERLLDYNTALLTFLLKKFKSGREIIITQAYENETIFFKANEELKPYQQLFTQNFVPDLSIIDLLFNCGPDSIRFL